MAVELMLGRTLPEGCALLAAMGESLEGLDG